MPVVTTVGTELVAEIGGASIPAGCKGGRGGGGPAKYKAHTVTGGRLGGRGPGGGTGGRKFTGGGVKSDGGGGSPGGGGPSTPGGGAGNGSIPGRFTSSTTTGSLP